MELKSAPGVQVEGTGTRSGTADALSDDAAVIARFRAGDRAVFGRLVEKYQDRVFNLCLRMCGRREDAADLTQEAFIKALSAMEGFGERAGFYTWLFRIATNLAIDCRRRRQRSKTVPLNSENETKNEESRYSPGRIASRGGPEADMKRREQRAAIEAALAELPDEHRAVVVLRDIEQFDYAEMAGILNVPVGTVKSRLSRARDALRDKLSGWME